MKYVTFVKQSKTNTSLCLFSLESGCVCPQAPRLKSPAQTNKGNWNCLFGETRITKGCFSYIMKSESHGLSTVSYFMGFLQLPFSPPLSPCKPVLRFEDCEVMTQTNGLRTSGSQTAGSSSWLCHFLAMTLGS